MSAKKSKKIFLSSFPLPLPRVIKKNSVVAAAWAMGLLFYTLTSFPQRRWHVDRPCDPGCRYGFFFLPLSSTYACTRWSDIIFIFGKSLYDQETKRDMQGWHSPYAENVSNNAPKSSKKIAEIGVENLGRDGNGTILGFPPSHLLTW